MHSGGGTGSTDVDIHVLHKESAVPSILGSGFSGKVHNFETCTVDSCVLGYTTVAVSMETPQRKMGNKTPTTCTSLGDCVQR